MKSKDPDPGSWMNNLDHISQSLETIVLVKIHKLFDADPGWKNSDPGSGMEKFGSGIRDGNSRIWDKHPGSATLVLCSLENRGRTSYRLLAVANRYRTVRCNVNTVSFYLVP